MAVLAAYTNCFWISWGGRRLNLSVFKTQDPLIITLAFSAALHLIAIAAVTFEPPDLKAFTDRMPPLEVVLVNAKTKSAPTKADVLAQANLDRGGNTDADRKMKTALPPPKQKTQEVKVKPAEAKKAKARALKAQAEAEQEQKRVAELEKQARELMSQIKAQKKIETEPVKKAATSEPDQGEQQSAAKTPSAAELMASSMDIARLEAQIAKQQDEYQKRPKRKFIGARAQEYRFAMYVESWRQKVEKVGNLNYPEEAKEKKIYGRLRLTVSIMADGSIENVEINQSSGFKVLDNAARRIVELAAPYAVFPEDIRKDTDIIHITRTWTFTKEDNLATDF